MSGSWEDFDLDFDFNSPAKPKSSPREENSWQRDQENKGKALRHLMKYRCTKCNRTGGQVKIDSTGVCEDCQKAEQAFKEAQPKNWGCF